MSVSRIPPGSGIDFGAIVPGTPFARATAAIYVGTGGTLVLQNAAGALIIFTGVPSGAQLDVSTRLVDASSTASNLVAIWAN